MSAVHLAARGLWSPQQRPKAPPGLILPPAHPACEAGVRASALAWTAALGLAPAALEAATAHPPALEALLELLLDTRA